MINRGLFPIILMFSLVFTPTCKKGKADFTLEGIVNDNTFQTPMPNQTVQLYEVEAGTNAPKLIGTTLTNESGQYSFTFPRNSAEKYILHVAPNNYFEIDETINFSDLTIEETNYRNVSTTAKSWVRMVFTNVTPANSWDNLQFTVIDGKTGCDDCLDAGQHNLIGVVDTVINAVNNGNTLFRYYYEVLSTPVSGYKSATTNAFDTTTIILEY